ncbi:hypothetical protein N7474_011105 [Penicillium riverlandense]|uniref:uncharacterized protein n=1 Tax=Penicillium riverlandense TaxID=1903569 RepID=UPI0025465F9D|nr:uncharacterized protein N7474_011105 [Penicillium riverlandense]KAJ5805218.1 hypothetical protein N7474_011105 [Penicillium riverlandense]
MSYFYPTAEYEEDQPLARTILTTHVLSRGFQLGSAIGLLNSGAAVLFKRRSMTAPFLLRSAGTGGLIGTGIVGVGLIARMWGREEIEWKDRSWRLRYNTGQVAVDNWSEPAAALGVLAVASRRLTGPVIGGWRGLAGGAGIGSLVGIIGCMCVTSILPKQSK